MELLLILIYTAICVAIFKIFSIPVNKWTLPTAALGGVFMIGIILLVMNYNHPFSSTARIYFTTTPILPDVKGRVIEVPVEPNTLLKAGDVLFRVDPQPVQRQHRVRPGQHHQPQGGRLRFDQPLHGPLHGGAGDLLEVVQDQDHRHGQVGEQFDHLAGVGRTEPGGGDEVPQRVAGRDTTACGQREQHLRPENPRLVVGIVQAQPRDGHTAGVVPGPGGHREGLTRSGAGADQGERQLDRDGQRVGQPGTGDQVRRDHRWAGPEYQHGPRLIGQTTTLQGASDRAASGAGGGAHLQRTTPSPDPACSPWTFTVAVTPAVCFTPYG